MTRPASIRSEIAEALQLTTYQSDLVHHLASGTEARLVVAARKELQKKNKNQERVNRLHTEAARCALLSESPCNLVDVSHWIDRLTTALIES